FVRWAEKRHGRTVKADVLSRRLLREYFEHLSSSDSRHKRPRALSTCQRNLTCIFTAWSWCYERDDELNGGAWKDQIPRPRKPNLPRAGTHMTVRAPTWKEMDRLIGELEGWGRKLAILQRCAGLRRGAALALTWADVDLEHGWLALRAEITKGGYGGRSVPLAPVLTQELKRWGPDEGLILADAPTGRALERRLRCFGQAWKRAGVDPRVWEKRPTHSLRKGFASGLRELGAQPDAVEVLLGHSLGNSRGAYIDHVALKLREAVALVPPLKL
ncbi:MAG: tyrosine-type recombinase/integrase, partial [Alphaproteobacteria bacterium]|nr:tyrosine-type recombinase/integrase [Alphaproteobacteria bacterium]